MEWGSLSQIVSGGTVTATDTFTLGADIHFISKQSNAVVRVKTGDNNYIYFKTVQPQQLHLYKDSKAVAKVAADTIKFSAPFKVGDQAIGGTIEVPAVVKLDDLNGDTSEVLIDNPAWLPARLAAQYVLTDRQLNYLYDDLLAQANELMISMKSADSAGNESTSTGIDYFASMGNVI